MDASQPELDRSGPEPRDRMPRWVRAFAIVGVVVAVVVVAALLFSGGHGPQQHTPGGDADAVEAPEGHQPPAGSDH